MSDLPGTLNFDLKKAISANRLVGLWRLMYGFRWLYISAVISLGIAAMAKTATNLLLRYFVDNYFGEPTPAFSLPMIAAGFVVLAIIEGGLSFNSGRLAAKTSEGVTRRLRNYLFDHIQHLSFHYHSQTATGDLIQRSTSDVDAIRRFFSDQAIGFGRVILVFVINFYVLLQLNVQLALVSILAIPLVFITSLFFFKRITKVYELYQEQDATLSTTLQENLSGVRVVKAFARQRFEIEKFERDNLEKFKRGKRLLTLHSFFWPVTDMICGLQILLGYYVGATMAINGTITVGTFLAYMGLVGAIIFPMRNLGRLIVQISTGMVSFTRVMDIIKEDREPLDTGDHHPTSAPQGEICFNKVGFEYEKDKHVLENIRFRCQAWPGHRFAWLDRFRQDDPGEPAAPLLRIYTGADPAGQH